MRSGWGRRRLVCLGLVVAAVTVAVTGSAGASGPPLAPTASGARTAVAGTLYRPPPGGTASLPTAQSVDYVDRSGRTRKKVFVGFSSNSDVSTLSPSYGTVSSTDGGASFPSSSLQVKGPRSANETRLLDGSLLDVRTEPVGIVRSRSLGSVQQRETVLVKALRSGDQGTTWTTVATACGTTEAAYSHDACLHLSSPLRSTSLVRFHQGLTYHVDSLGRPVLLLPYYAQFDGDPAGGARTGIAGSTDGGRTWRTWGTIARPYSIAGSADVASFSEASVTHLKNGSLYAVLRVDRRNADGDARARMPMMWSVSTNGATWTTPRTLTASDDGSSTSASWLGVSPVVRLMPNGVWVLVAGRLDDQLAIADGTYSDGTPRWRSRRVVYSNYPTAGLAVRTRGSSGYMGLVPIASNRALVVMDNCGPPPWGCPTSSGGWTSSAERKLVKAYADILTPDTGKIDVGGMLRSGSASIVSSDFRWTSAAHPETRSSGAFDGSNEYWSGAMAANVSTTAQLTLRLDREHLLTRVGLSLQRGFQGTAELYYTRDPARGWTRWSRGLVGGTSQALSYYGLSPAVPARYVRVVVHRSGACAADIGPGCASLNELELYSGSVLSFENDAVNAGARDYPRSGLAFVTEVAGSSTTRSFRLRDNSRSSTAYAVSGPRAAATSRTLELRVKALSLTDPFLCTLDGYDRAGHSAVLYRVAVSRTAGLRLMVNGVLSSSDVRGTTGLFRPGTWHSLRLVASLWQAAVIVDGVQRATLPRSAAGVRSFTTHTLSSSGMTAVGDVVVDDVQYR